MELGYYFTGIYFNLVIRGVNNLNCEEYRLLINRVDGILHRIGYNYSNNSVTIIKNYEGTIINKKLKVDQVKPNVIISLKCRLKSYSIISLLGIRNLEKLDGLKVENDDKYIRFFL